MCERLFLLGLKSINDNQGCCFVFFAPNFPLTEFWAGKLDHTNIYPKGPGFFLDLDCVITWIL